MRRAEMAWASDGEVRMRAIAVLTLGLAQLLAPASLAQPAGAALSEYTVFGDNAAQCHDGNGRSIALMKVVNLGDVGRAWIVNRVPVIAMDPQLLARLPDKLQRFFYDHECAHHVLHHWVTWVPDRENQADCWAIKRERDQGILTRDEILGFAPFFAQSGGSAAGHLPGPQRIQHMLACFEEPVGG